MGGGGGGGLDPDASSSHCPGAANHAIDRTPRGDVKLSKTSLPDIDENVVDRCKNIVCPSMQYRRHTLKAMALIRTDL